MGIVIERKTYEILEPGVYPAIVESIEPAEGVYGPQLKWQFVLLDHDGEDEKRILAWSSQTLTAKSKLNEWATAILGAAPDRLDLDDLINRRCQLALKIAEGKDGQLYNKVDGVYPWRAQRGTARPVAQAAEPVKSPPPAPAAAPANDDEETPEELWETLGKR